MSELIDRQAAIDAIANCTNCGNEKTLREYVTKHSLENGWTGGVLEALDAVQDLPTAQPDENAQEFIKLTVRNSNGRPYYSIIYLEYDKNGVGHDFVGYSSYSLDVISDYLKKYFMPPAQPEPTYEQVEEYCKKRCLHVVTADFFESTKPQRLGHWVDGRCNKCGGQAPFWAMASTYYESDFCPHCGTKMKGETT